MPFATILADTPQADRIMTYSLLFSSITILNSIKTDVIHAENKNESFCSTYSQKFYDNKSNNETDKTINVT